MKVKKALNSGISGQPYLSEQICPSWLSVVSLNDVQFHNIKETKVGQVKDIEIGLSH